MTAPLPKHQHTPGPWHTKLRHYQIVVYGPKDIQVLATSWHGTIRASYPLKDESIANATLAAAAPEMLEALKAIAEFGEPYTSELARAAISKAQGEQT